MTAEDAFHPDTSALVAYGRAIAAGRAPPAIKAADRLADRLFVLDGLQAGRATFLTFGAELIALFGRDLRGGDLGALFLAPDRALAQALLGAVLDANAPAVATALGETACGLRLHVEVGVTPLAKGVLPGERLLGLVQPLGGEGFLEGRPIARLRLTRLHPPLARIPARPRLVVSNP